MLSRVDLFRWLIILALSSTTIVCSSSQNLDAASAAATQASARSTEAAADAIKATLIEAARQATQEASAAEFPVSPPENPIPTSLSEAELAQLPTLAASATALALSKCPAEGSSFSSSQSVMLSLVDAFFTSGNQGYILAQNINDQQPCQLQTADGGLNWKRWPLPTKRMLHALFFVSPDVGWVVGAGGTILKTENEGKKWVEQNSGRHNDLYTVQFWDKNTGWAGGADGTLLWTDDGGSTWNVGATNTTIDIRDMAWISPQEGYLVAVNNQGIANAVLHSQDGGRTWQDTGNEGVVPVAVFAAKDQTSWLAGGWVSGSLWKGIGRNSSPIVFEDIGKCGGSRFRDVYFTDEQHGWAVGDCGMALATQDGGANWQSMDVRPDTHWLKIQFLSSLQAVLIGARYGGSSGGYFIQLEHSTDSGKNWMPIP